MNQLFCKMGDLAVTVEAELPINIGNVVKIIGVSGYQNWSSFKTKIFLWKVEVASEDRPLVYENPNGSIEQALTGRVPDHYLRPIRPDELEWFRETEQGLGLLVGSKEVKEVEYV